MDKREPRLTTFTERDLRDAMGRFATGVTVVTTMTPEGPLGMTVNSFASVSLDPPLVLWSPARRSKRFAAFEVASHFAVHVLSSTQRHIAEGFARSGTAPFDGLSYRLGAGGVPLLPEFLTCFECCHSAGHDGGDHLIVVGEVLELRHTDAEPLLYYKGQFSTFGQQEHG